MAKICLENIYLDKDIPIDYRWKKFATIQGLNSANIPKNASEILVLVRAIDIWYEHHIMTEILTDETIWNTVSGYSAVHGNKDNYSGLSINKRILTKSACMVSNQDYNNSQVSYCYYR